VTYTDSDIFYFLVAPVFAYYALRYAVTELSDRSPTEEDMRRLEEAHGFLTFSASHSKALRFVAFATITACMWTAMAGFDWPLPVGLMIAGFAIGAAGISWTYYLDYWTKRK
jgi:hypothetical protein